LQSGLHEISTERGAIAPKKATKLLRLTRELVLKYQLEIARPDLDFLISKFKNPYDKYADVDH